MDCTFTTDQGKFNYRVGAIILRDGRVLMARNPHDKRKYYYSVGGRVKLGESLDDAVIRELKEETGVDCEIDRFACIHENFFSDDDGVPYHEVSVFFLIRPNEGLLHIEDGHPTDFGPDSEYLTWVDPNDCGDFAIYPAFLKTVDFRKETGVLHFLDRE